MARPHPIVDIAAISPNIVARRIDETHVFDLKSFDQFVLQTSNEGGDLATVPRISFACGDQGFSFGIDRVIAGLANQISGKGYDFEALFESQGLDLIEAVRVRTSAGETELDHLMTDFAGGHLFLLPGDDLPAGEAWADVTLSGDEETWTMTFPLHRSEAVFDARMAGGGS